MIGTVFRSDDVPAEHRFDYWRELVHRAIAPSDMSSEYAADFWARQRLLELGPVMVWPTSHLPTRFRRTEKMVRQSDPEMYHLSLVLGGGLGFDHVGRSDVYGPRDLWVSDTSRPYDVHPPADRGRRVITGVGVDFPKALLPLPPRPDPGTAGETAVGAGGYGRPADGVPDRPGAGVRVPPALRCSPPGHGRDRPAVRLVRPGAGG